MTDVMLLGVLRMPIEATGSPLSPLSQFVARAREAADRIEADAAELATLRAERDALRGALTEADDLLGIAWSAHGKMGLRGEGSNCTLSHEVRMFALEFSPEGREGPGVLQVQGTGRFIRWRRAARAALAHKGE